jgi:hypothetical protein
MRATPSPSWLAVNPHNPLLTLLVFADENHTEGAPGSLFSRGLVVAVAAASRVQNLDPAFAVSGKRQASAYISFG